MLNFFAATKEAFWNEQDERSYIGKTVGVQALFDVLRLLLSQNHVDISGARKRTFLKVFERIAVDFSDSFFQASGTGRTRIRNVLLLGIGVRRIESLRVNETDLGEYQRLMGGT